MPSEREALDHFGRFLTEHLRDACRTHCDYILASHWKAPGLQALQTAAALIPPEEAALIRRVVAAATDAAIHDFLFALQEQADFGARIRLTVDGIDIVSASDGIHGEAYGSDGWYARFSTHGQPRDEA